MTDSLAPSEPRASADGFASFSDFYPYYLAEHSNFSCRVLHFIGTFLVIDLLLLAAVIQQWWPLALMPLFGYGFAWVGHFFFEHNKPATFKHPLYSLIGDYRLFFEMLSGKHWQR